MDYQKALDKYLVDQVSIYPPFFSPLWIKTTNFEPKVYAEKIFYYENIIYHPDQVILALENSDPNTTDSDAIQQWNPWEHTSEVLLPSGEIESQTAYVLGEVKTTNAKKYLTSSSEGQFAFGQIKNALTFTTDHYTNTLELGPAKMSPIMICKYYVGSEQGQHVDTYKGESYLSAVLYLNDNYDGGELHFPNQGVTIKPSAGSVVVFPSGEPFSHEATKVIKEEKYIATAFLVKD